MVIELDPGTRTAGEAPTGFTVPVDQTLPNVNFDEILVLAGHGHAQLPAAASRRRGRGARRPGQGAVGHAEALRADRALHRQAQRRAGRARAQHPPLDPQLPPALAGAGRQGRRPGGAGGLVQQRCSGRSPPRTRTCARRCRSSRAPCRPRTPRWPRSTELAQRARADARRPAARRPRPRARAGADAAVPRSRRRRSSRTSCGRSLARRCRSVKVLRPAASDLAVVTPKLTTSVKVLNYLLNELAYNPPGKEEGYLFWASWASHAGATVFSTQDAHGPIRHGLVLASCSTLQVLQQLSGPVPQLGTLGEPAQRARPGGGVPDDEPGRRGADAAQPGEEPLDAEAGSQPRSHPGHGGLRALLLRAAALPVARLRRPDPAAAEGLPLQRGLQGGRHAVARRPTCGSPASPSARSRSSTPTSRPAPPTRRSSSTPRTRRSPRTRRRSCARRRCWARPTSS